MAKKKATAPTVSNVIEDGEDLKRIPETVYIETGNVGIDIGFTDGKGIPMGTNIMFFGLPGTGKTTIFCDMIVRILRRYKAAGIPIRMHYIDSESSRELLRATGVMDFVYDKEEYAPQQVIYHEFVNSFDYLEQVYQRMITAGDNWSKDVQFVFIDSVTKLLANTQLTKAVNEADFGDNARARKKLYGKWLQSIKSFGITQFWSVQMAGVQNAQQFAEKKKPAVSDFDKHEMDIIVKLTADKDTRKTDINKVTVTTIEGKQDVIKKYLVKLDPGQATHTKNRHGQLTPLNVMLYPGHGVINAYLLRKMLEAYGLLDNYGSDLYNISPELVEYLGPEALEKAGITKLEKVKRKPYINKLCSLYNKEIIQMLKERDLYHMIVKEEAEEDDGLF